MGTRVVDDASLAALADKLRARSAAPDPAMVFPSDFMDQVDLVHEQGRTEGIAEGTAHCTAQHFVHNFVGDGSGSASFYIPFEPDALQIIGFDPTYSKTPYALAAFTYDRRAFGLVGGSAQYGKADGNSTTGVYTTTSVLTRYSRSEDGTITIGNISASAPVEFSLGYDYTVVAVKYTEQTDKERITAFVEGLTGSGTVTLNKAKVEAAFTDDEWAELVATKPSWTFAWI